MDEETPLLGLATTEELLTELAVRMEVTQNSDNGRKIGSLCREAIDNLSPGVLRYSPCGSRSKSASSAQTKDHLTPSDVGLLEIRLQRCGFTTYEADGQKLWGHPTLGQRRTFGGALEWALAMLESNVPSGSVPVYPLLGRTK